MKLFSLYSEEVKALKEEWFVPTIRDDWELHIENIGTLTGGEGTFRSDSWFRCIRRKHEIILEAIEANTGDIIIWSDIDVQFFGECSPYINDALKDCDVVFQAETFLPMRRNQANTGFIAIRCNECTRNFFARPLEIDPRELGTTYQLYVNDLLAGKFAAELKWGRFPKQIWARSEGWLLPEPLTFNFPECIPTDLVLHHANCAGSLEEKVAQLQEVRRYVLAARQEFEL